MPRKSGRICRILAVYTGRARLRPRHQRRAGLLPRGALDADRSSGSRRSRGRPAAARWSGARRRHEHAARRRHGATRATLLRPVRRARHPRLAGLHVRQHGLPGRRRRVRRARRAEAEPGARARSRAAPAWRCCAATARSSSRSRCWGSAATTGARLLFDATAARAVRRGLIRTCRTSRRAVRRRAAVPHRERPASRTTTASARYRRPLDDARRGRALRVRVPRVRNRPTTQACARSSARRRLKIRSGTTHSP